MKKFTTGGWGLVPEEILALYPKINVTGLKDFNTSPAFYESRAILKETETTKAMDLGTKLHYAILEPLKFEQLFVIEPKVLPEDFCDTLDDLKKWCSREGIKTSGTKADLISRLRDHGTKFRTYDEFIFEYQQGRQLLKEKELHAAQRILGRIKAIKSVDSILQGGEVEKLGWVLHAETNVIVSFRIDYYKALDKQIGQYKQFAVDLKTTNALTTYRDMQNLIAKDDTHIQGAFYVDALEYLTGLSTAFAIFGVETTAPFTTMMQIMGGATLEAGRADYEKNIREFKKCKAENVFPTGFEKIGTAEMSVWKLKEIEDREAKYLEDLQN